jgi:hypothetical protein
MNVAMTGVSFSTIVMKASYIVPNPINYTARTVCPSAAPPPTQVSPIAQGSQQEQSSSDIFVDVPHVQGDFVLNQAPSIKHAAHSIKQRQSSPFGCFDVRPST